MRLEVILIKSILVPMNFSLFLLHIFLVVLSVLLALRMGRLALVALIALQAVLANLFVVKQMDLFGLTVTCSDVFAIGSILGLNLLQEHFGKEEAKNAIKISFFILIFFGCMALMQLAYIPSHADETHVAFALIFSSLPRIVIASFAVYYLVQKWDIYFFHYLHKKFVGKKLAFRLSISLFISQAIDTGLFSFLGLYGIVESVWDILLMSYFVKCVIIALSVPLATFSKKWMRSEAA